MYSNTLTLKIDSRLLKMLENTAKKHNVSKAVVVREAIEEYVADNSSNGGDFLLKMAKRAEKVKPDVIPPKDLVENMNKYLYEPI